MTRGSVDRHTRPAATRSVPLGCSLPPPDAQHPVAASATTADHMQVAGYRTVLRRTDFIGGTLHISHRPGGAFTARYGDTPTVHCETAPPPGSPGSRSGY